MKAGLKKTHRINQEGCIIINEKCFHLQLLFKNLHFIFENIKKACQGMLDLNQQGLLKHHGFITIDNNAVF